MQNRKLQYQGLTPKATQVRYDMHAIPKADTIQQRIGRWSPGDLAFVDEIAWRCSADGQPSALRLKARFQRRDCTKRGWPDAQQPFASVSLLFTGIANLKIDSFGRAAKQIAGFDITDVSGQGLEGIRYSIEDYENGHISFQCADFCVEEAD